MLCSIQVIQVISNKVTQTTFDAPYILLKLAKYLSVIFVLLAVERSGRTALAAKRVGLEVAASLPGFSQNDSSLLNTLLLFTSIGCFAMCLGENIVGEDWEGVQGVAGAVEVESD